MNSQWNYKYTHIINNFRNEPEWKRMRERRRKECCNPSAVSSTKYISCTCITKVTILEHATCACVYWIHTMSYIVHRLMYEYKHYDISP